MDILEELDGTVIDYTQKSSTLSYAVETGRFSGTIVYTLSFLSESADPIVPSLRSTLGLPSSYCIDGLSESARICAVTVSSGQQSCLKSKGHGSCSLQSSK